MASEALERWKRLDVAEAHDEMNREYLEAGTMDSYPTFSELLRVVRKCSEGTSSPLECLDVGCGAGWQMRYLSDRLGNRIGSWTGIDLSEHMCTMGRRNLPAAEFHAADFMEWKPGRTWDVVMSCGSMLYVPDWRSFLDRMSGLSRRFVIIHRTLFTDDETKTENGQIYRDLEVPVVVVNYGEFLEVAAECGLAEVERFGEDAESVMLEKTDG